MRAKVLVTGAGGRSVGAGVLHAFGEEFGWLPHRRDVAAIRALEHVLVPATDQLR